MEPVVRRVRPGDGPELRALRLEMLADTPIAYVETVASAEQDPPGRWTDQAQRNSSGSERATFVAEVDGRFVATATGAVFDGPSEVVSVYITPEYRGKGLLEQLIEVIAAWSLEHGRPELFLEVAAQNPRAIAAYARLGFVMTGHAEPHPLYAGVTELQMSRPAAWPARTLAHQPRRQPGTITP
jgi:predicted GNAT family acetyltransferase